MKTLNSFIIEKLKLGKDTQINNYNFYPESFDELRSLLEQLLEERRPDADLNDIDVSQVTSFGNKIKIGKYEGFYGLFYGLDPHNIDISKWDVSNVEDMSCMFCSCENFDCNLSKWNVSNVKNMEGMFQNCKKFDCDLSNWNVSNVKSMRRMFQNCINFTGQGLENWKIDNVKDMRYIFDDCSSLKNKPSWYKQ